MFSTDFLPIQILSLDCYKLFKASQCLVYSVSAVIEFYLFNSSVQHSTCVEISQLLYVFDLFSVIFQNTATLTRVLWCGNINEVKTTVLQHPKIICHWFVKYLPIVLSLWLVKQPLCFTEWLLLITFFLREHKSRTHNPVRHVAYPNILLIRLS